VETGVGAIVRRGEGELEGWVKKDCACTTGPTREPREITKISEQALRKVYIIGIRSDSTSE
jgi:hypothetical protein